MDCLRPNHRGDGKAPGGGESPLSPRRERRGRLPGVSPAVPLTLAAALWLLFALAAWQTPPSWDNRILEGVGRAIIEGGAVGRQALTASALHGLLPNLGVAFLGWIIPDGGTFPWAASLLGAIAVAAVWVRLWHEARRRVSRELTFCLVLAAVSGPISRHAAGNAGAALGAACGLVMLFEMGEWVVTRRLRNLVAGAFLLAGTLLCGIDAAGWGLSVAGAWALAALAPWATIRRWPGRMLLLWLPLIYALGVWALMNRLIMGDALYFVRALMQAEFWHWPGWRRPDLNVIHRGSLVLCAMAMGRGIPRRDARAVAIGFGGVAAWGWLWIAASLGHAWSGSGLELIVFICGLLSAATMASWWTTRPVLSTAMALLPVWTAAVFVLVAPGRAGYFRATGDRPGRRLAEEVERFVLDEDANARVFVCGYDALGLLGGESVGRMHAVIDLHPAVLREDYWGQRLFLLVPRPRGRGRWDNGFTRYPRLYDKGLERALYITDWEGDWRLFELVGAPSPRQSESMP